MRARVGESREGAGSHGRALISGADSRPKSENGPDVTVPAHLPAAIEMPRLTWILAPTCWGVTVSQLS